MALNEQGERLPPAEVKEYSYRLPDGSSALWTRAQPERFVKSKPVILAPGLGETSGAFERPSRELAKLGHDTFALSHTRGLDDAFLTPILNAELAAARARLSRQLSPQAVDALLKGISLTEFRKAYSLKVFIESEVRRAGYRGEVNAMGHSQGGAYVLIAAFLWPHLFSSITLVNPAGQIGAIEYEKLSRRFHDHLWYRIAQNPGVMLWMGIKAKRYIYALGGYSENSRAVKEGRSLSIFNAYPYLLALRTIAPHIRRTTIVDQHDSVFPAGEVQAAAERAAAGQGSRPFGERIAVHGVGHYSLIEEPDKFASLFDRLLS